MVRDRAAIGVLAVAWREAVAGVSLRLSAMIDLLGAEAAVAIGRADLLGQLEHLARTDALTGLPNRRHWEQQLPARAGAGLARRAAGLRRDARPRPLQGLQRPPRPPGRRPPARARPRSPGATALRPYDILARYGGEEFSVILPGCDARATPSSLVERLRAVDPGGRDVLGRDRRVGRRGARPRALVGRADAALYEAKRAGRDRVVAASNALTRRTYALSAQFARHRALAAATLGRWLDRAHRALPATLSAPPLCAACGAALCGAREPHLRRLRCAGSPRARPGRSAARRARAVVAWAAPLRGRRPRRSSRRSSSAAGCRLAAVLGAGDRRGARPVRAGRMARRRRSRRRRSRRRRRGFDPAELIAGALAARARAAARRCLRRADGPRQVGRPRAERLARRRRGCGASARRPHAALLVDDVLTTGATLAACARGAAAAPARARSRAARRSRDALGGAAPAA